MTAPHRDHGNADVQHWRATLQPRGPGARQRPGPAHASAMQAHMQRLARALGWLLVAAMLALATLIALAALSPGARAQPAAAEAPPAAAAPWRRPLLRAAHTEWGLAAPVALFAAQVHAESAWRPDAISRVGAQGLAQFMPATAAWWCQQQGQAAADCLPRNPQWALRALVGYDAWLHARLGQAGPEPHRSWAMLRAYNGGLGHWRAEAALASDSGRHAVDAACGRARRAPVHCAENLAYPRRVLLQLQPRYLGWGPGVEVTP